MKKFLFILRTLLLLAACSPAPTPTPTLTPTKTPTPLPTPTKTPPAKPENVHDLVVYNYETDEDEVLSPIFDEGLATWVWKNGNGEVRRFLDLETGHVFAQTESVNELIIYQIDTYGTTDSEAWGSEAWGWEVDLTQVDAAYDEKYQRMGPSYLSMINEIYPGVVNRFNENTKIIFKMVHGSYDDIADKSRISQTFPYYPGDTGNIMSFFWPVYDIKNNIYTLKAYFESGIIYNTVHFMTKFLIDSCPTSTRKEIFGTFGKLDPPKPIQ